jgi:pimeloyl-ACP methyl ester carboxylesterase
VKVTAGDQDGAPGGGEQELQTYPALLLHGQPGSANDWAEVIDALDGRVTAFAIDRPGWDGESDPGGLALSARAARAALDERGVERAVIVGLSFGGAVAAWLAVHHPERVAALVLVSPAANRDSLALVDRILGAPVAGYLTSSALLSSAGLALSVGWVRGALGRSLFLSDDYLSSLSRRLRSRSARRAFFVEQQALLRDLPALERSLGRIAAPTTVLVGTDDTVVPASAGRRLAEQIPGAELIEIERGRHTLFAEHPQRIADVIVRAAGA